MSSAVAVMEVRGDRGRRGHDLGRRDRPLGDDVEARVEQQLETAPAGVDDAGVAEHRQEVGGAGDGGRAAFAARSSTSLRVASPVADACSTASAASRTTVRIVPSTGRSTAS